MLAACHMSSPSHPFQTQNMPQEALLGPLRRAGPRKTQDSPRCAQDGPEEGRQSTGKFLKTILEPLLCPSLPILGLQTTRVFVRLLALTSFPNHPTPTCSQHADSLKQVWFILSSTSHCQTHVTATMASKVVPSKLSRPQRHLQTTTLQAF